MAIKNVKNVTFAVPTKRSEGGGLNTAAVDIIYKAELDGCIKRDSLYCQNKASMYDVAFGQCSEPMWGKLEGDPKFEKIKRDSDVVELLHLMRDIAFDIESDRNPFVAQVSAIKNYINIKQGYNTTNKAYYDNFINNQEVLEPARVDLSLNDTLLNLVAKK